MLVDSWPRTFYPRAWPLLEEFVRRIFMLCLVIALSASLIGIPTMAKPANRVSVPLGLVMQAERAHVGADITSGGATIYEGDRLETQGDGTMRARLGGSQMYLRPSTITDVRGLPNGFAASLLHGTVIASSPEGQTFELIANGATIHPFGKQATMAQVTWVSPNELLLTANVGAIQVSLEGELKTIEAGNSYRMEIEPEEASPQGGRGPSHGGRNHAIYIWVAVAAAATAIGVWRALVSPSSM